MHVEHPKLEDNNEWLDVAELAPVVPMVLGMLGLELMVIISIPRGQNLGS